MKLSAGVHIGVFVWCIFMGITAVSIGVGALWPPLNLVAKPFVCPNGQMTFNQETSNPLPGTTYTITGWVCVDQTGEPKELDIFTIALPAGVIYGLVLEVVALGLMWYLTVYMPRRAAAASGQPAAHARHAASGQPASSRGLAARHARPAPDAAAPPHAQAAPHAVAAPRTVARMKELQALRDQNLISETEFEKKRDEILKDL